jgi:hypothetical protein
MIINSIRENLFSLVEQTLIRNNAHSFIVDQHRFDNLIINTSFIIRECLVLDDNGVIIDGFTMMPFSDFPYKGKSFFELLGGGKYTPHMSRIASPIDTSLYINNPDTYTPLQGVERY